MWSSSKSRVISTICLICLTLTLQPGHVLRVIDGDTFILYHVGVASEERVRVLGVDTPEMNQVNGPEAKAFTEAWLAKGPFRFMACKRDSFGRYLGNVMRDGDGLAEALIATGLGVKR